MSRFMEYTEKLSLLLTQDIFFQRDGRGLMPAGSLLRVREVQIYLFVQFFTQKTGQIFFLSVQFPHENY